MYLRIKLYNLIKGALDKKFNNYIFIFYKKKIYSLSKILFFILFNFYMYLYQNCSVYYFNIFYKKHLLIPSNFKLLY